MRRRGANPEDVPEEAMLSEVQNRLAVLKQRPYSELQDLPEWSSEQLTLDGIDANITTYREGGPPDSLRIIVQFSTKPKRFLLVFRTRQVVAEGFEIYSSGAIQELPEKDLYYYM
jgi:hypothetical protein